jgi:hypothetical protein
MMEDLWFEKLLEKQDCWDDYEDIGDYVDEEKDFDSEDDMDEKSKEWEVMQKTENKRTKKMAFNIGRGKTMSFKNNNDFDFENMQSRK